MARKVVELFVFAQFLFWGVIWGLELAIDVWFRRTLKKFT